MDNTTLDEVTPDNGAQHSERSPAEGHATSAMDFGPLRERFSFKPVYSAESSPDLAQYLREEGGRTYNSLNHRYVLPSDNSEWARLDKQHTAFKVALNGLYPCPEVVREILKPQAGVSKDVLDLGCGTGAWVVEMAREFPHANVIGADLVPVPLQHEQIPSNCQMEIHDINGGLTRYYDRFDVIQMRCVYGGLKDFRKTFFEEIPRCLKSGGLLFVFVADTDPLNTERTGRLPMASNESPEASWYRRIAYELMHAVTLNDGPKFGTDLIVDEGFWDQDTLMDPETCGTGGVYFPIGPWTMSPDTDRNNRLQFCGTWMRQNLLDIHRIWHSALKKFGIPQETLDEWSQRVDEELHTMRFKSWVRYRLAWGRRRAARDQPAPRLSVPDVYIPFYPQKTSEAGIDSQSNINMQAHVSQAATSGQEIESARNDGVGLASKELYQIEVYRTKTEALEAIKRREGAKGSLPYPLVAAQ